MNARVRLLSVEDNENDDLLIRRALRRGGIDVVVHRRVDTLADLTEALDAEAWDVCVCDYNLVSFDALAALEEITKRGLDLPTLVVTGSLDEERAATIFRAGARDLIRKGRLGRLAPAIEREMHEAAARREARLANERLRSSQALFGAFMRHLPAFVFVKDESDRYAFANDAFLRFFGRSADQVVGKTALEALGPELGPRFQTTMKQARDAPESVTETAERFTAVDGSVNDYSIIRFRVGEGTGLAAGVGFDVTERNRASDALRANEERFRTIAEAMGDGMITKTVGGEIRYANRAAERMLGRPREAMIGSAFTSLLAPRDRARHLAELPELLFGMDEDVSAPRVIERTMLAIDGSFVPVELSLAVWELGGERLVTAILRDTRARRALEEQMRHAQKLEAVGQLAGGVAHDFNNILGVISAYAELVSESVQGEARDDIEEIRLAVRRGSTLVSQLLMFSRKQVVQPIFLSPDEVVRQMQMMLTRAAGPRIECSFELDSPRKGVLVDRGHLEQVLMNLVVNARDAIASRVPGPPGRIVIATRFVEDPSFELGSIVLSVNDNGTGMDEETRARIFEPFFSTKESGKGTGLGLSTVHGIVEQAGGRVEVLSVPGHGTTFSVVLGCARNVPTPSVGTLRTIAEARPGLEPLGRRASGETILLVEDDRGLRAATGRTLRREGYNVIELPRAELALGVARALDGNLSLVVTDLGLPGMSGLELCRALRAEGSMVPVVLMSGSASEPHLLAAEPEGLLRLRKPIPGAELLSRVGSAIEASMGKNT